jgi:hypothetical protein
MSANKPFGRVCEHGLSASHSWACYEEEYGESKADFMDDPRDYDEGPDDEEAGEEDEEC